MGLCFGMGLPLTTTTMVEHLPLRNRGKWIVMINFFITIGKLLGVGLAYLFLGVLGPKHWKQMIAVTGILPFMSAVGLLLFVYESPRFCLFNDQASRCYSILKCIQRVNFGSRNLLLFIDNDLPLEDSKPDQSTF